MFHPLFHSLQSTDKYTKIPTKIVYGSILLL